ncbi:MAG: hypothetical protein FWD69_19235 [Polyangiaceae bacterium]|nr:hypothetical protein [Polyangiaceae bacterium]
MMAPPPKGEFDFARIAEIGVSAQAAIPGLYAWAITVAPAAWSRTSSSVVRVFAVIGVVALITAPILEVARLPATQAPTIRSRQSGSGARLWSIWGFVFSSAVVWAFAPSMHSLAKFDAVRGVFGVVGWALFAFASAGPSLRTSCGVTSRVAGSPLKPRSELVRGDGIYVGVGVMIAFCMQIIGWDVASPERAVLVRLVTLVSGIAVISAMTDLALARHIVRVPATRRLRLRRSLPWIVIALLVTCAGVALSLAST